MIDNQEDIAFMRRAIELSKLAVLHGNEPFGAVLVKDHKIVMEGENKIYTNHDYSAHAELSLLKEYSSKTGLTDLTGYTLYSSCEPCFMCSGSLVWFKLSRLVYGASDIDLASILNCKGSECSSIVFENSKTDIEVTSGVLKEESIEVLRSYFSNNKKN